MHKIEIKIPAGLEFSALELHREKSGAISFRWEVIEKICQESGIPIAVFKNSPEDNVAGLLVRWYFLHLEAGGKPDAVAETLLAEVELEDGAKVN